MSPLRTDVIVRGPRVTGIALALPALGSSLLLAVACGNGSSAGKGNGNDTTDSGGAPDVGAGTSSGASSSGSAAEGGASSGTASSSSGGTSGGSSSGSGSGDGGDASAGGLTGADGGYVLPSGRSYPDTSATIALLVDQLPSMNAAQMKFATSHYVGTEKQVLSVHRAAPRP